MEPDQCLAPSNGISDEWSDSERTGSSSFSSLSVTFDDDIPRNQDTVPAYNPHWDDILNQEDEWNWNILNQNTDADNPSVIDIFWNWEDRHYQEMCAANSLWYAEDTHLQDMAAAAAPIDFYADNPEMQNGSDFNEFINWAHAEDWANQELPQVDANQLLLDGLGTEDGQNSDVVQALGGTVAVEELNGADMERKDFATPYPLQMENLWDLEDIIRLDFAAECPYHEPHIPYLNVFDSWALDPDLFFEELGSFQIQPLGPEAENHENNRKDIYNKLTKKSKKGRKSAIFIENKIQRTRLWRQATRKKHGEVMAETEGNQNGENVNRKDVYGLSVRIKRRVKVAKMPTEKKRRNAKVDRYVLKKKMKMIGGDH